MRHENDVGSGKFTPRETGALSCLPISFKGLVDGRWQKMGATDSGAYTRSTGTDIGPPYQRASMSDKSPRQTMTKKSGKSLKEKRAVKRGKTTEVSQTESLLHTKKR